MNWFPQIGAGAVAQFPLNRNRQWRAIVNVMESGEMIALPDANGGQIEWRLSYQELTDAEVAKLTGLFAAVGRRGCGSFPGFVGPKLANLLGWSEDLSKPDRQLGLLTVTRGQASARSCWERTAGMECAKCLRGAEQTLVADFLGIPGDYRACFSVYVRSDSAGTIGMVRDTTRINVPVGPQMEAHSDQRHRKVSPEATHLDVLRRDCGGSAP